MASNNEVHAAVSALGGLDEDKLYGELGLRLKAISNDPRLSADFTLEVTGSTAEALGLKEDFKAFGKHFFERVSAQCYGLICGSDPKDTEDRKKLAAAAGMGKEGFAAILTGLLIAHLGLAPVLAPVVALLLIRLFFTPTLDAMCDVWHDKLPAQ